MEALCHLSRETEGSMLATLHVAILAVGRVRALMPCGRFRHDSFPARSRPHR